MPRVAERTGALCSTRTGGPGLHSSAMEVRMRLFPEELKEVPQWVLHRRKVPLAAGGGPASVVDPATWSAYRDALAALPGLKAAGLGFVFTRGDPWVGVDLDRCLPGSAADSLAERLGTYTETSLSGSGLHLIARAPGLEVGRKGALGSLSVEVYSHSRYFACTGDPYREVRPVADRKAEVEGLLEELRPWASLVDVEALDRIARGWKRNGPLYSQEALGPTGVDRSVSAFRFLRRCCYAAQRDGGVVKALFLLQPAWRRYVAGKEDGWLDRNVAKIVRTHNKPVWTGTMPRRRV